MGASTLSKRQFPSVIELPSPLAYESWEERRFSLEKISDINDMLWRGFFHYMRHVCDNVPILLLVFGSFAALIVMIPTLFFHKKCIMTRTFFVVEGIGACSIHGMLMHLPLLHTRIHTALATASSIVMSSQTYLSAFQDKSGIQVKNASDIVYYLWYMDPHDMEAFTVLNPSLLYEKVYKAFIEERYLFGEYINTDWLDQKSLVYLLIAAAGILLTRSLMNLYEVSRSFLLFQILVFLLAVLLSKHGTLLFLTFFTFSFYCYTRFLFFLADRKTEKSKKFKQYNKTY